MCFSFVKKINEEIIIKTKGNCDIINITGEIDDVIKKSKIENGSTTIFVIGSTAALTTVEYEPGLIKDLPEFFNKIIPKQRYHHDNTWGDGNGHAHLRSALVKTSFTVPVINKQMTLGTWQQIILIDFDNRQRNRRIVVQIIGE